nr:hypothetical protein [Trebouxia sp. A1-2]
MFFSFSRFFFGKFNESKIVSDVLIPFRFFCFSWYLTFTSVLVFIIFNSSLTKQYFYKLLGRDYVKSKIGNPGASTLGKFATSLVEALVVNERGKYVQSSQNGELANQALDTQIDTIDNNPYLTPEQKSEYTRKALDQHSEKCGREFKGSIVDIMKYETVRKGTKPTVKVVKEGATSFSSWWKK